MLISIFVQTQFEGFHCWPDAPEEASFLRSLHRHIFHVKAYVRVSHANREVEFVLFKQFLNKRISYLLTREPVNWSCEKWAETLLDECQVYFSCYKVEVSEDGENGAIVEIT